MTILALLLAAQLLTTQQQASLAVSMKPPDAKPLEVSASGDLGAQIVKALTDAGWKIAAPNFMIVDASKAHGIVIISQPAALPPSAMRLYAALKGMGFTVNRLVWSDMKPQGKWMLSVQP